jgi:hypothetical protein
MAAPKAGSLILIAVNYFECQSLLTFLNNLLDIVQKNHANEVRLPYTNDKHACSVRRNRKQQQAVKIGRLELAYLCLRKSCAESYDFE